MKGAGSVRVYFESLWNFLDVSHLIFTPVLAICNLPSTALLSKETQTHFGSVAAFILVTNALNWLRISDNTAFYIKLIAQTV